MNARNTPLTEAEKLEIRQVYLNTNNQVITAQITKHSLATVWKVLKQYGLNKGQGGNQEKQIKITDEQLIMACKTMSLEEIATKYGMHPHSLPRRYKKLGVKPVKAVNRNWGKHNDNLKSRRVFGDAWHYISSQDNLIRAKHPNFLYLETKDKRIRLRCKKCGTVIERASSTVRRSNIQCDYCKEQEKNAAELLKERIKLIRFFIALKESKNPKVCACCGEVFFSEYLLTKYCSKKCKQKVKARGSGCISRAKKYGREYEHGITINSLIDKYGETCQICGKPIDTCDNTWGMTGPLYPSIDHILPLAKGGTHTWDNVQLAHIICNSFKSDNVSNTV